MHTAMTRLAEAFGEGQVATVLPSGGNCGTSASKFRPPNLWAKAKCLYYTQYACKGFIPA